jgi:hypothetical protein
LLVAVQEHEKVVIRLIPWFREAVMELAPRLNAKGNGKGNFRRMRVTIYLAK